MHITNTLTETLKLNVVRETNVRSVCVCVCVCMCVCVYTLTHTYTQTHTLHMTNGEPQSRNRSLKQQ